MTVIPTDIDSLTAEVLTDVLRERHPAVAVTDVAAEPIGTGQMAGSYRLTVTYADPVGLPATMVAKLATGDRTQREFGAGAFRNEVNFYRDLAETFAVPVPACFGSVISADGAEFVLLLEDLASARQGDQLTGCTPAQAEAVAVAAAGLHGPRWNDPELIERFPLPTDGDRDLMDSLLEPMATVYRDRVHPGPAESKAIDHLVATAGDWLMRPLSQVALVHGDLRIDNVLFGPDGGVTIIDWQTIVTGSPMRDIAFLLATSLDVADRRRHERQIVEAYHQALLAHGVTGYDLDNCWRDYVTDLIQAPLIVVFGSAAAQPTARGDEMFATMLTRGAAALADLTPGY